MYEHTPSSRVQLRGLGDLPSPACCIVCGNGTNEQGYFDWGIFVDYHGALLLCMTCMLEAMEASGGIVPLEAAVLMEKLTKVASDNDDLTQRLRDANERLEQYDGLLRNLVASEPDLTSDSSVEVSEPTDFSVNGSEGRESESEESTTESRPRKFGEVAEDNVSESDPDSEYGKSEPAFNL